MALRDLSGLGAMQDSLGQTNAKLEAVLAEMRDMNGQRLEQVAQELRGVNERLDRLLAHFEKQA
jgi:hypothetical protein